MAQGKGFLANVPWYVQLIILLGLVAIVSVTVDFAVIAKTRRETEENKKRLEELQRENKAGSIILENLRQFEQSVQDSQRELEGLKQLLPEAVELSNVLETIQAKARKQGLILRVFRPLDPVPHDYYTEKPIFIDVSGEYNKLGAFFADMASYGRINNITNLEVYQTDRQSDRISISSTFTLTVFYVSPENLAKLESAGTKAKDKEKGKSK